MTGTIKKLVRDKGFGFLVDKQGQEYFFHSSAVRRRGFDQLTEGQEVLFDPTEGTQPKKGPRAENVEPVVT